MPLTFGKKPLIFLGLAAATISTLLFYVFWKRSCSFRSSKLMAKESLLKVLNHIRKEFSENYYPILRLNRVRRRSQTRGGPEYVRLVRELRENATNLLQRALEHTYLHFKLTEGLFVHSLTHWGKDEEVNIALDCICGVIETKVSPVLTRNKLEGILTFYLSQVQHFDGENPDTLNLQMKMLEDEVLEEFGFEAEEIEAAVEKHRPGLIHLVSQIRELHREFREVCPEF